MVATATATEFHKIFVVIDTEYLIYDKNCKINLPRKCVNSNNNLYYIYKTAYHPIILVQR